MAPTTLSVLSNPDFPQVCSGFLDQEIRRVTEIYDSYFPVCVWESPESFPGDPRGGIPCRCNATVTDLIHGPMCAKHFHQVNY